MSKRHMKRFSTSRVDREKQIKTPVRCHLTPVRMAIIEKTQRQVSARTGGRGTLEHCKWVRPPWETVRRVLRKLNLELSYDPVIALLGIYPTKSKIVIRKDRRAPVFTVACTAATRGRDLRAHRQTIRYREASRTWTCDGMPHVESDLAICDTRVETELSEISQTGKDECHVIPLTCGKLKNNNNAETNS